MRVLLIGSSGQVGQFLSARLMESQYEIYLTDRNKIDISVFSELEEKLIRFNPEVIINASAYTNVDEAEIEQNLANLINHLALKKISEICKKIECILIHISTDYVFDGTGKIPYKEDDITNPLGVYGETKRKGEMAIEKTLDKYIILRTSWVFSELSNNFLKTMIKLGKKRNYLEIVSDQYGCPTYADDIADAIMKIILKIQSESISWGTFHFCGDKSTTWYEFANFIFDEYSNLHPDFTKPDITRINSNKFFTKAKRPIYAVLDTSKIQQTLDIKPSNWKSGVIKSLRSINKNNNI